MPNVSFVEVVNAGPGWTQVRASDGNTYTFRGDRNWRNNTPGNIEYGAFARAQGAIGSDGRFAVFPSYDDGFRAQETLQFESPRYRDLTIAEAISRYAPPFENNTAAYAAQVAAAAGVNTDTVMSELTPQQRSAFLQAQQRVEGFQPGRIEGVEGQPVPANVVRQFSGVPVPPVNIPQPSNTDDPGEGATGNMLARFLAGGQANPVAMSPELAMLSGRVSPTPASMSDALARSTGRVEDVPLPRARPSQPTPIADNANITPLTFGSPRPNFGIVDSVASPNVDMASLAADQGTTIGRDGVNFDRIYDAGNRMSTGGLGALLDPRSFSPATPNPAPRPSLPGITPPATAPQSTPAAPRSSVPASYSGASNYGSRDTVAQRQAGQEFTPPVATAPPQLPTAAPRQPTASQAAAINYVPPSVPAAPRRPTAAEAAAINYVPSQSGITKIGGTNYGSTYQPAVSGTTQLPRDVRPNVPPLPSLPSAPAVPQFIPQTIRVAVNNTPSAIPLGTQLNFGSRDQVAQRAAGENFVQQYETKTIMVPNPAYVAPPAIPEMPLAPIPATMSPQIAALRAPAVPKLRPDEAYALAAGRTLPTRSQARQSIGSLSGLSGGSNITDADKRTLRGY